MAEITAERHSATRDSRKVLGRLLKELVSKKQLSPEDLGTVLNVTIQKVVDEIQAEAITIFFVDKTDQIKFAHVYYSSYLYGDDEKLKNAYQQKIEKLKGISLKKGQGIVGKVIATGKSIFTPDVAKETQHITRVDEETGFRTKSMITVPIIANNIVIGAIQVLNKRRDSGADQFTEQDCRLLEEVADYSAKIIQKCNNPQMKFSDKEMAMYLAKLMGYSFVELKADGSGVDERLLSLVGEEPIRRHMILPLKKTGTKSIKAAVANPVDYQSIDAFQWDTKLNIDEIVVSSVSDMRKVLDRYFKPDFGIGKVAAMIDDKYKPRVESVDIEDGANEESGPIIQLCNRIIEDAYGRGASDIHVEHFEHEVLVRYRVDGILSEQLRLPKNAASALVSRLKIMSKLDIAERRLPQDGRIKFKEFTKSGVDIDLRVATGPMAYGEKVVMRILDKASTVVALEKMGYSEYNLKIYKALIQKPYGMILHVGPTGSGKTTSLYAALNHINHPSINIQTAEDPIEYMLRGINQMQIRREIGLTFASALRCYLRQDPDVILVGEIRDKETAEIAIEAAMTGHLLFSTLHTNDAAGTVTRLIDMGIEPFLITSSLLMVVAQRLLRKLCACKEKYTPSADERELLGVEDPDVQIYKAGACEVCNGSGFKGRLGSHEILTLNDEIKKLIVARATTSEISKAAVEHGMITIYRDAMDKVLAGVTAIDEVLRVVRTE